jgi:uncharacterized protein (DUF362 family)
VAKRKSEEISRRNFLGVSVGAAVVAGIGCGSSDKTTVGASEQGGASPNGGTSAANGGATSASGGATSANGGATSANGGATSANGGTSAANGGTATGGTTTANGGATTGGAANGGAATGGTTAKGGTTAANGGATTGGKASGGAATAGGPGKGGTSAAGGASAGGKAGATSNGGTSSAAGASSTIPAGAKLVGIVRDTDLVKATKDAIAAAGGLPDLSGKTVLIKPNLVANTASPCCPNPDVIRGVLQAVKAAGATKILIGDGSASGSAPSVMAAVGIHTVTQAEASGGVTITEVNFSTATLTTVPNQTKWPSGANIYKDVLDDGSGKKPYIINVPVCKHHGTTVWSMAMKNWYGIVPSGDRKHVSNGTANQAQIPELHLAVKEDFVVMDATKSYLDKGPSSGTEASPGIVVASVDAVAVEATGLAILKQYRSAAGIAKDDIENVKIFSTDTKTLMGRALTLGNGWIKSREEYSYAASGLGADEAKIIAQLDT